MKPSQRVLTLALAFVIATCGGSKTGPERPSASSLVVRGRARIAPGEIEPFQAIVQFADGTSQDYTKNAQWSSSNPDILSIDRSSGVAKAGFTGEALVTGRYGPYSARLKVMVVPSGTYRLTGQVLELGLPLGAVSVSVASGQGTGLRVTTDPTGQYRLYGVAGPVEIQASKKGYTSIEKAIVVGTDELLDFPELTRIDAIGKYAGAYTLTITMDPDCAAFGTPFPADAKTRTYAALVTQEGPRLIVALSGGSFRQFSGQGSSFEGRVDPDGLRFTLGSLGGVFLPYYYYTYHIGIPNVAELLSTGDYLTYIASTLATASPTGIAGPLFGEAMLFTPAPDGTPIPKGVCASAHHQFSLTPKSGETRQRR